MNDNRDHKSGSIIGINGFRNDEVVFIVSETKAGLKSQHPFSHNGTLVTYFNTGKWFFLQKSSPLTAIRNTSVQGRCA